MNVGKTLQDLIETVKAQSESKRDLLAGTQSQLRMVQTPDMPNGVALVTLDPGAQALERFAISDTAHGQIAGWLKIPAQYYNRLLADHTDLVVSQVNALFEREPGTRMVRTLDGKCRAFLSDRYRRIDNCRKMPCASVWSGPTRRWSRPSAPAPMGRPTW
jgi:hypothetical protein